jgi:hypothetical protein
MLVGVLINPFTCPGFAQMATINSATFVKSTTMEGALLEVATLCQAQENTTGKNPNSANNVSVDMNTDRGTVTISATLPINYVIDNTGKLQVSAKEYLTT